MVELARGRFASDISNNHDNNNHNGNHYHHDGHIPTHDDRGDVVRNACSAAVGPSATQPWVVQPSSQAALEVEWQGQVCDGGHWWSAEVLRRCVRVCVWMRTKYVCCARRRRGGSLLIRARIENVRMTRLLIRYSFQSVSQSVR
jgi:hypothetical protein